MKTSKQRTKLSCVMLLGMTVFAFSTLSAQTNVQEMYDFNRGHLVTTVEAFHADSWGNTFLFTDIYHPADVDVPTSFYTEIGRTFSIGRTGWGVHLEWNGGNYANNAFMAGVDYSLHNADFSNVFTFRLMYKHVQGGTMISPLQATFVWNMNGLFGVRGLQFTGNIDWWHEEVTFPGHEPNKVGVFLSEPQLWYNVGRHFGCANLNVGGELRIGYNFAGNWHSGADFAQNRGLAVAPCLGAKWTF